MFEAFEEMFDAYQRLVKHLREKKPKEAHNELQRVKEIQEEKDIRIKQESMSREDLVAELEKTLFGANLISPICFGIPTLIDMEDLSRVDLKKFADVYGLDFNNFSLTDFYMKLYQIEREFILKVLEDLPQKVQYMWIPFQSEITHYSLLNRQG